MKNKVVSLLLSLIMIFGLCMNSLATNNDVNSSNTQVIDLEDGSHMVITLYENPVLTRGTVFYKSGGRVITLYDNNYNKYWEVDFDVTFKVDQGVSATCTAASFSAPKIYDSTWRYITNTTSKNGNKGSGTITMKKYFLGLPVRTESPSIAVTCDKYGNLT